MTRPKSDKRFGKHYREVFFAYYGPGPHSCFECGSEVVLDGIVHHLDHDEMNDDPSNLAAAHRRCHMIHHRTGMKASPETRKRISDALKKYEWTPEHRRAVTRSVAESNKRRTPEQRREAALKGQGWLKRSAT